LGKAIFDRKIRKLQQAQQAQQESEFVEFEEVIKPGREKPLDLPPMEKQQPGTKENPYKDLF
jgi:hypothetical protein